MKMELASDFNFTNNMAMIIFAQKNSCGDIIQIQVGSIMASLCQVDRCTFSTGNTLFVQSGFKCSFNGYTTMTGDLA